MTFKKILEPRAQAALEYFILLVAIAAVTLISVSSLFQQDSLFKKNCDRVFDNAKSGILGE